MLSFISDFIKSKAGALVSYGSGALVAYLATKAPWLDGSAVANAVTAIGAVAVGVIYHMLDHATTPPASK